MFYYSFFSSLSVIATIKELLKSAHISKVIIKINMARFFMDHRVYSLQRTLK